MELSKVELLYYAVQGLVAELEEYRLAGVSHEHAEVEELLGKYRFTYNQWVTEKKQNKKLEEMGK